ncbi:restriction endonuclease [Maribellus comscasis]|uniref:Restriction endonuclease n=1 Tax=Maribellus comscasis TaxID=2681766 RepID=A0A6I6JLI4_9BACT|nr:HNH endonuclease [Maribellus comscasis]QGY43201.1 restriction endonuclease [Maribellus comscasis]
MENLKSQNIRSAVFNWLNSLVFKYPDKVIPSKELTHGCIINGERIVLSGAQGIWKPKQLEYPISIKSVSDSIYDDVHLEDNLIHYKYRGTNPNFYVNVGLRECMNQKIPLVYLHQVVKGKYLVEWPVFIVADDPRNLTFTVEANAHQIDFNSHLDITEEPNELERKYATRQMIQRLHQGTFRERVLEAYHEHCAMCNLKHRELLDAAHIIPDNKGGKPVVPNGLSLCKIHHAAFDQNIIGITPDYQMHVREDILSEIDGPMLKHGIQEMHGNKLILPRSSSLQPNKAWLEERFDAFKRIG